MIRCPPSSSSNRQRPPASTATSTSTSTSSARAASSLVPVLPQVSISLTLYLSSIIRCLASTSGSSSSIRSIHIDHRSVDTLVQHHPHLWSTKSHRSHSHLSQHQSIITLQTSLKVHRHSQSHSRTHEITSTTHPLLISLSSLVSSCSTSTQVKQCLLHRCHQWISCGQGDRCLLQLHLHDSM